MGGGGVRVGSCNLALTCRARSTGGKQVYISHREPTMIFGHHRGATLWKCEILDFYILLHFTAFAISSVSEKCHLEGLSSDLAKKQEFRGEEKSSVVIKNPQIKIPKTQHFSEQVFTFLRSTCIFTMVFENREKLRKKYIFSVEVGFGRGQLIADAVISASEI